MITAAEFFGGAKEVDLTSSDRSISPLEARFYRISAGTNAIKFPAGNSNSVRLGGPVFYIWNATAGSINLNTAAGALIVALPAGNIASVGLVRPTAAGTWYVDLHAKL